jgi:hypothetical protein
MLIPIPPYIFQNEQEYYHEQFNQAVRSWLNVDGFPLPTVTDAELTVINGLTPAPSDGTMWYVSDAVPPTAVIKINGALEKITTTPYP